jgi:hypothetical protein
VRNLKTKVFKIPSKYGLAAKHSQAHPGFMSEVILAGDVSCYPHARLTPIGGLWEGAVEIVTPATRTTHVCIGVYDDADDAL